MPLPLSILDLAPIATGVTSARAMHDSLELARLADRLGYQRYWFAEHHNMPMIASTTPAILIALAGAATRRIRVGAGGVMLPNHAPLQVAEAYRMLESLYPGRVDLGIGRAPGTDPVTAHALRRGGRVDAAEDFPEQLAELLAFGAAGQGAGAAGKDAFPAGHPYASVKAMPEDAPLPPIWLLGSSGYSAQVAARMGRGFGFAAHFSPQSPEGPMLAYRQRFQAVDALPKPHAILAIAVICAETNAEAEELAAPMQLAWVRLRTGRLSTLPTPQEALGYAYSPAERAVVELYRSIQIIGDPKTVRARMDDLAARTQADELMITTVTYDPAARRRSYALLAREFGLTPG